MVENSKIDIDTMLWHVGDFGRYQLMLLLLFSVINVLSAFHYFGQTFISIVPEHKCKLNQNQEYHKFTSTQCSISAFSSELPCTNGWIYNNSHGFVSIIEELNWVCEEAWKPAIGQSIFFIGSVLGSLIFGVLADSFGRLHILVASNILAFLGNIATILVRDGKTFAISRFFAGAATDTNFVMMYIIVMEYIRPSLRTFGLNICIGIFYCFACMIVPWLAVLLENWKILLLAISLPHLIVLSFYFLVPESAQWLISKNRTEEAIRSFKWIARINRKNVEEKHFDSLRRYCSDHVKFAQNVNFWNLLSTPKLRRKTLILIFKSMAMTLGYDAISRNVNGLKYSPFVIFSLTSSTIFPACIFIMAVQDRIGRKALASASLLISGLFTATSGIIQSFIGTPEPVLIVILAVIARLGITIAYNSGAQYAVELIPTCVRAQGISVIHVTGYAATFFSPQILYLASIWKPSPEVILGILIILAAVACLFLPETLNRTLPVTLEEGEDFGEDEGIFEFASCKSRTESTIQLSTNACSTRYTE